MNQPTKETRKKAAVEFYKTIVKDPKAMGSVWELKINFFGTMGVGGFGGRVLSEYIHPLTGKTYPYHNTDGKQLIGFNIERPTMHLHPRTNGQDAIALQWLMTHPEVEVIGIDLNDEVKEKKNGNLVITLTNIDFQENSSIDDENLADEVIGKLSVDGVNGISLERLRYLLAFFNLPYRDKRFVNSPSVEKNHLRKKLKDFARTYDRNKIINATHVMEALAQIDNFKINYELKEMLRLNIIREHNGVYKYNNVPLGTTIDVVTSFFKENADIYMEAAATLADELKREK